MIPVPHFDQITNCIPPPPQLYVHNLGSIVSQYEKMIINCHDHFSSIRGVTYTKVVHCICEYLLVFIIRVCIRIKIM